MGPSYPYPQLIIWICRHSIRNSGNVAESLGDGSFNVEMKTGLEEDADEMTDENISNSDNFEPFFF